MKQTSKGFLPAQGLEPFDGLDVMSDPALLPPGASPNTTDFTTFRGVIQKRSGYSLLGAQINGGAETIISLFNFNLANGTNLLIACTPTHVYSWDGTSWTDRTPSITVAKLTKLSGGNGWSVTAGSFTPGQFVTQATSGAVGMWLTPDATYYYVATLPGQGIFDDTHAISVVATSGSGTLTLTGNDPAAVTETLAIFPILTSGNGWTVGTGVFDIGLAVNQVSSGATGIWAYQDSTNYYIAVISGTFDNTGNVTVSASAAGHAGTLVAAGTVSASTTTRKYAAVTTQTIPFHGSTTTYVDSVVGADINLGQICVIVNGIDWPMYWNGLTSTFSPLYINAGAFLSANVVAIGNGYLVFANILTQTDHEPRTTMWSDTGNFQEWLIGNSGDLIDISVDGDILRLIPFASNLIMFTTAAIGCLCYINSDVIFGAQIYVTAIKVAGPRAICNINPFIAFAGQDNIYMWDGTRIVAALGDKIAPGYRSNLSQANIRLTTMFYDPTLNQIKLTVPTGATTQLVYIVEVSLTSMTFYDAQKSQKAKWFQHTLANPVRCLGVYNKTAGGQNFFNVVIGSDTGNVFIQQGELTDAGTNIVPVWDSHDFVIPEQYQSLVARWLEVEMELSGNGQCLVSYSTDHGQTWSNAQSVTLGSNKAMFKLYVDVCSRFLRLRFTMTSSATSALAIFFYRVWFRPGGAR